MPKAGIQFSNKDEWYTPKAVVEFFGVFDYDPATTKEQAEEMDILDYDTIETDGLKSDWSEYRKIWINPPFTKKFEFLEKAVHTPSHIFFLTPIETMTTKKFHEIVGDTPFIVHAPNGRIKFHDAAGGGHIASIRDSGLGVLSRNYREKSGIMEIVLGG